MMIDGHPVYSPVQGDYSGRQQPPTFKSKSTGGCYLQELSLCTGCPSTFITQSLVKLSHLRWAVKVLGHEGLRAGVEVVDEDHGVVGEGLRGEHLEQ